VLQHMASATSSYSLRCKSSHNLAAFPLIRPWVVVVISPHSLTRICA